MEPNAKLKRRFGQIEDHDQRQVNEASESYKMKDSKMADLSVVSASFSIIIPKKAFSLLNNGSLFLLLFDLVDLIFFLVHHEK